jgi:REP element-mobilizing transposase RayT
MTAPRQILPHTTFMVTRRCLGRKFLLRPSRKTDDLFRYILAVAAERFGILIHALCVMPNHFHCVLTDPFGKLPKFEQYLDGLVARSFNALHGRWESFWAPGSYSAVRLLSRATVVEKAAYVLANPVKAGLVRHGREWPGLRLAAGTTAPERLSRPEHFFRPDGPLPPEATLELVCPPGFASVDEFRKQLARKVGELEDRAARKVAAAGRSFMGARRVMAQKVEACPANAEPRRGLNPRVAVRDRWKRIEALTRLKEFTAAYREAWRAFTRGARGVLFPAGTYWMRVAYGVRCAAA